MSLADNARQLAVAGPPPGPDTATPQGQCGAVYDLPGPLPGWDYTRNGTPTCVKAPHPTDVWHEAAPGGGKGVQWSRASTVTPGTNQRPIGPPEAAPPAPEDVPRRTVHHAILAVMEDVRAVGKDSLYNQGGTRFQFRGVEAVMNAVAPAARRHGLIPAVVAIDKEYKEGTTKAGGAKLDCYVTVTWQVHGPDGDHITVMSAGEASDTADKATSKALAVARRNMWVDLLCLATQDWDENAPQIERGERVRTAVSYRDEILADTTSAGRLRQIGAELRAAGRFDELVEVDGEEVTLGALGLRVATERRTVDQ